MPGIGSCDIGQCQAFVMLLYCSPFSSFFTKSALCFVSLNTTVVINGIEFFVCLMSHEPHRLTKADALS